MNSIRRLSSWTGILLILLILSGCTGRPVLTKENSYSIIRLTPDGESQKTPIELTWNSNAAVMQELLLEASFVLSDLHTQMIEKMVNVNTQNTDIKNSQIDGSLEKNLEKMIQNTQTKISTKQSESSEQEESNTHEAIADSLFDTILLEANFPNTKKFSLTIDNEQVELDISSIQIEVDGKNPGRVILNQVLTLQGIPNPNLKEAYNLYIEMLNKIKKEKPTNNEVASLF